MAMSELLAYTPPLLETPANPRVVRVGNTDYYEYAFPEQVTPHIKVLSALIRIADFDEVFVNIEGGRWIALQFMTLQHWTSPPLEIEYHRPPAGYGAIRTKPIPPHLKYRKCLVFEDVYDSGGCITGMQEDGVNLTFVVATQKTEVPGQLWVPRIYAATRMHNKWAGGLGMNISNEPNQEEVRNYPGILFNPIS